MDEREWAEVLSVLRRDEPRPTDVESRLRILEDKETIRDLLMRYAFLEDARQRDAGVCPELLELFTDDVERRLGGTLDEHVTGKDALRQVLEKRRFAAAQIDQRHLTGGEVIRVSEDGTHAWVAAVYSLSVIRDADRGEHDGTYVFELRKATGRWRIARCLVVSTAAHNPLYAR